MKKKILLTFVAVAAVAVGVVGMSAFEAHVINVTARIENALNVPIDEIKFGTVFPQEELYAGLEIGLSESFMTEPRVDDVEYMIRQKPKCGWTLDDGQNLLGLPTYTGHVEDDGTVTCPDPGSPLRPDGAEYGLLPSLCEYLSKHKNVDDPDENQNEVEVDAFHLPWWVDDAGAIFYTEARGRLAKSDQDILDRWVIDLKVPCFGDHCAQDWESFVAGINLDAVAADYVQPIENEHKVFGCDLWVEVTEVSESNGDLCSDSDLVLVLDRSGSIDATSMADLKDAAIAFVAALIPTPDGVLIGQSSFSWMANLDTELTNDVSVINAGINALGTQGDGLTNLEDGILVASTELVSMRDRDDTTVPDYMVVITDGAPTTSNGSDPLADAIAAADAADSAGTTIYVVGVNTTTATADYLRDNIATSPAHYFDVANYSALEATLSGLASCDDPS